MRKISLAGAGGVFLTLAACSGQTASTQNAPAEGAVVRGEVEQPATVTAKGWEFRALALPKLEPILKAAKPNPFIYGLYTWTGEYKTLHDSIKQVGWRSIRSGGPFDDEAMRMYAGDDVEVMPTLAPAKGGPKLDMTELEHSAYIEAYGAQVKTFVARYGPEGTFFTENPGVAKKPVRAIEICNEPNFQYLIPPDGRPGPELEKDREALYAKLLPAAYGAAKSASKEIEVVGFGAGGSGAGDMRFIQHVHENNPAVAKSYDILSTHPYVEPAPPEAWSIHSWGGYGTVTSLKTIRSILEANGRADAPIWYTEVGWPIAQKDGGRYDMKGEQVSPLMQAACVCRLYALAQRLGVERVDIMFATDTDHFNAGFFGKDGAWRPSAFAVQNMIKLMPAPKLVEAIVDGEEGAFVYRFLPAEQTKLTVVMAWNVGGAKVVEVPVKSGRVELVDMLGHSHPVKAAGGKVRVEAGPYPVYLVEG